ncbi:peptidoglycan D,D-transpeptidase FtsI family protein, partial [Embleya sp. NPDC059213]|uniref:peptidoglycan D,D-transpeptidase FtsI family protein n=2 Tax=Embleya TaxID=2699295 RepID=UPI00368282E6
TGGEGARGARDAARADHAGARPVRPARPRPGAARPGRTHDAHPAGRPRPAVRMGDPRKRLRIGLIALGVVLTLFAGRLLQLQALDAPAYAAQAAAKRTQTVNVPAERGSLTDAFGVSLAKSVDAYDVTADPAQVQKYDPHATALALAPLVNGDPVAIEEKLRTPKSRYVVLAAQVEPAVWNHIRQVQKDLGKVRRNDLVGIYSTKHSKRVYPAGPVGANLVGFVNATGHGGGGLEMTLDGRLAGKDGRTTQEMVYGRRVPTSDLTGREAVPGADVQLTVSRDLQWYAEQLIGAKVTETKSESGTVVVQDVRTGQILAMATAPGYDPNHIGPGDVHNLGNRAVEEAYEPGSTGKVMTMAAVIQEGRATPGTHVTVPNRLARADQLFKDEHDHPTQQLTLAGVLAKSSNIGTILASEQLSPNRAEANAKLHDYLTRFGVGQPSGLKFPGETPGILAQPQKWNGSQQYTIPFGQGLSVNSVQATSVFQTIANGGVRIEPSLVKGSTGPDGKFKPAEAPKSNVVVSPETARQVSDMLETVVADDGGTGKNGRIPGYRVAGKTGTANRVDPKTGRYNGYTTSFIGFAPADNPQVVVSVTLQAPGIDGGGGSLCAPVFQQVMTFALQSRRIAPSGSAPLDLPIEW